MAAPIDLRSDAVTQPTEAMWDAMRSARIGWAAAGEDEHVAELERQVSALLGKEAGLFLNGGGAANLLALLGQCERGEQVVFDDLSHILWAEEWGFAYVGGLTHRAVKSNRGCMDPRGVEQAICEASFRHRPRTALVCVENSHNAWGGAVLPPEHLAALGQVVHSHGAKLHLDGARLLNAAASLGVAPALLVEYADSVSFNLNKGLSAPLGAVLCGPHDLIARSRVTMKRLGMGTPHQAGLFAVAGLVGLRTMVPQHDEDNRRARDLAAAIQLAAGHALEIWPVQTNIVFLTPSDPALGAEALQSMLEREGVRVSIAAARAVRMVTHRHIDDDAVQRAAGAVGRAVARR